MSLSCVFVKVTESFSEEIQPFGQFFYSFRSENTLKIFFDKMCLLSHGVSKTRFTYPTVSSWVTDCPITSYFLEIEMSLALKIQMTSHMVDLDAYPTKLQKGWITVYPILLCS